MTTKEGQVLTSDEFKAALKTLLITGALGATTRSVGGLAGNIARNLRRNDKDNRQEEKWQDLSEFSLPVAVGNAKTASIYAAIPANLVAAAMGAPAGFWLVHKFLSKWKDNTQKDLTSRAKKEFEAEMAENLRATQEPSKKYGSAPSPFTTLLEKMAQAYVDGEFLSPDDVSLQKSAGWVDAILQALGIAASVVLPYTAFTAGRRAFNVFEGRDTDLTRLKTYKERSRRARLKNPPPLQGTIQPIVSKDTMPSEDDNKVELRQGLELALRDQRSGGGRPFRGTLRSLAGISTPDESDLSVPPELGSSGI